MSADDETPDDGPDRAAILARRRRFLATALDGIGDRAKTGAKLAAVTGASVGAACGVFQPCLNFPAPEESGEATDGETNETGETGETEGSETGETEGTETGGTGETGETSSS